MTDKVTLEPTLTDDEVLDWLQEFFAEPLLTWNKLIEDVRYYAGCWVVNMDANNEALISANETIDEWSKFVANGQASDGPRFWLDRIDSIGRSLEQAEAERDALVRYLFELEGYVNITAHEEGWERLSKELKDRIFPPRQPERED